jgi:hypothetical protein
VDHLQNEQDESLDLEGQQGLQLVFRLPLPRRAPDLNEFGAPHTHHVKG